MNACNSVGSLKPLHSMPTPSLMSASELNTAFMIRPLRKEVQQLMKQIESNLRISDAKKERMRDHYRMLMTASLGDPQNAWMLFRDNLTTLVKL